VGLYVDANNTNFTTLTGSVISGILNITTIQLGGSCKTAQFIREISILNPYGSAFLCNCKTIGTDFTELGYFGSPTISIVNTNQISIQVCNPSGAKSMAYFSGIEMKG
jgi:hypothetical protein